MKTSSPLASARVDRKAVFRVIAVAGKPDSLGMKQHILTTRDGVAYSASRAIELEPLSDVEVVVRSDYDAGGSLRCVEMDWEGAGFEFPVRVMAPSREALNELFPKPEVSP